jgi:hypothetical protein
VTTACECARLSLPVWERYYLEDRTPHVAIETAERWTRGEATLEEVQSAADASYSAADASCSAGAAASAASAVAYAAYAGACASTYAAASAAAYAYASDAAYTASAYASYAASAYASDAAARASVLRECADIVRRHYPEPPAIEEE